MTPNRPRTPPITHHTWNPAYIHSSTSTPSPPRQNTLNLEATLEATFSSIMLVFYFIALFAILLCTFMLWLSFTANINTNAWEFGVPWTTPPHRSCIEIRVRRSNLGVNLPHALRYL